jgi:hypothetical protein
VAHIGWLERLQSLCQFLRSQDTSASASSTVYRTVPYSLTSYMLVKIKLVNPIAIAWAIKGYVPNVQISNSAPPTVTITRGCTHHQSPLMDRIIEQLRLDLVPARGELSPDCRVPHSDRQGLRTSIV